MSIQGYIVYMFILICNYLKQTNTKHLHIFQSSFISSVWDKYAQCTCIFLPVYYLSLGALWNLTQMSIYPFNFVLLTVAECCKLTCFSNKFIRSLWQHLRSGSLTFKTGLIMMKKLLRAKYVILYYLIYRFKTCGCHGNKLHKKLFWQRVRFVWACWHFHSNEHDIWVNVRLFTVIGSSFYILNKIARNSRVNVNMLCYFRRL